MEKSEASKDGAAIRFIEQRYTGRRTVTKAIRPGGLETRVYVRAVWAVVAAMNNNNGR